MTFRELREHLFSRGRFGIRPGLATIRHILEDLGNPQRQITVVHVAGTNGKGSTAAFLAAILQAGGYRVGLYTSPHLISYTERFKINGAEITEDELQVIVQDVLAVAPEEATFFELTTASAVLWFARCQVDLAILEVGMGGRWDATNAADNILSIITPISLDHCRYLGESISAIAAEKAGVISGGAVICASQDDDALRVIADRCTETGSLMICSGPDFRAVWHDDGLTYHDSMHTLTGLKPGIPGRFQQDNAACALAAAGFLAGHGFPLRPDHLRHGIESAYWPGRMEVFPGPVRLLLDGAHNPAGVRALRESLSEFRYTRLILLLGMMADKDRAGVMEPLLALAHEVVVTSAGLPHAVPPEELRAYCERCGRQATVTTAVAEGVAVAREKAASDDLILVTGSLYLVGEVRGLLLQQPSHPFAG